MKGSPGTEQAGGEGGALSNRRQKLLRIRQNTIRSLEWNEKAKDRKVPDRIDPGGKIRAVFMGQFGLGILRGRKGIGSCGCKATPQSETRNGTPEQSV